MVDLLAVLVETPTAEIGLRGSLLILCGIMVGVAYLIGGRDQWARGLLMVGVATMGHVAFVLFFYHLPDWFDLEDSRPTTRLIEFEIAEVEEPEPEPEPEPPPEEEPEELPEPELVEPELQPKEPPPKPKTKQAPKPDPNPVQPEEAAAPKRFDMSNTTGGSTGVVVQEGSGGEYGGQGKADSEGKGKGKPKPSGGDPKGSPQGTVAKWEPRSELFIKHLPKPVKVPKIQCPATAELGIQGDVVLKIQIQSDGKVRKVKVIKGIGQGCDQVAVKALKQARFKPAVGTNGKPVDFELRYEYAFKVSN